MSEQTTFGSWWPFTFAGAARFAYRPLRMLLGLQFLVACASAATIMFYFHEAWWPLIKETIDLLPSEAGFDNGQLRWFNRADGAVSLLSHNALAGIIVDPERNGRVGQLSDVQLEFGGRGWKIRSLFGYLEFNYGDGQLKLDSSALQPAWGAWKPVFLFCLGVCALSGLFACWLILATLGAPIAKLMSFFADRDLTIGQAWKICGASLMPGAIFFSVAILLYTFSRLNLLGLALACAIHLIVSAAYMLLAPCRLPKKAPLKTPFGNRADNPFKGSESNG